MTVAFTLFLSHCRWHRGNCYHLQGPSGVRVATQRIRQVLLDQKPKYIIRADVKSFGKSIPHYQLVQDIKQHYDDEKVQAMLEQIIINPIETPRGYKNPDHGIALRGPLSDRRLSLSRKKTRIGRIDVGFHFLGIHYPGTQTQDNTNVTQANDGNVLPIKFAHYLTSLGGDRCCN